MRFESYCLSGYIGDKSWGTALAVGGFFQIPNGAVRTEIEYSQKADAENSYESMGDIYKAKIEIQSLMLNAFYDIDIGSKVTPYIGGGIGYAKLKLDDQYWKDAYGKDIDDNNFAWQIGAGVAVELTDNVSVDAGYRYVDYGDLSATGDDGYGGETESVDVTANEFYLGARYTF